jgi:Mn2+/Fe2+ NRAMP family transporter
LTSNFHEHFRESEVAPPSERATGIVFACVALLIAAFAYSNPFIVGPALALSAAFALTSWLKPALLAPLNRAWFRLSLLLNRVVNPIVMLLIYAVAIVPTGLIMQALRDPLSTKPQRGTDSYWQVRDPDENRSTMSNQF